MNVALMRTLMVAFSVVLIPNISNAFYAPHMGRWTSRDPVVHVSRIGSENIASIDVGKFVSRVIPNSRPPIVSEPRGGYVDGFNLYEYVHDMPTVGLDPYGLLMVCCGDVRGNSCERQFKHCELTNGNTGRANEECYPVWQDDDCKRTLDDGTQCCKATPGQISACFKRHPYSAGQGLPESNCQQSTVDTIGSCCLKSSWSPNWYANPNGSCINEIYVPSGEQLIRVCIQRAFPACNWHSNNPPDKLGELPPF